MAAATMEVQSMPLNPQVVSMDHLFAAHAEESGLALRELKDYGPGKIDWWLMGISDSQDL